jgi:hypothetical protein
MNVAGECTVFSGPGRIEPPCRPGGREFESQEFESLCAGRPAGCEGQNPPFLRLSGRQVVACIGKAPPSHIVHGTNGETGLTVIDKVPADDPGSSRCR